MPMWLILGLVAACGEADVQGWGRKKKIRTAVPVWFSRRVLFWPFLIVWAFVGWLIDIPRGWEW